MKKSPAVYLMVPSIILLVLLLGACTGESSPTAIPVVTQEQDLATAAAPSSTSVPATATTVPPTATSSPSVTPSLPLVERDGGTIAFTSSQDGNMDIYIMEIQDGVGGDPRRLTDHPREDYWPTWSPDGTQIAFSSVRDGNYEIYAIDVDGSNLRRLTDEPGDDLEPAWSPSGNKIAFMLYDAGRSSIYTMNPDGSGRQELTEDEGDHYLPKWSPDGAQIVFVSERDGNPEIYVMTADGSEQRRLTDDPADDNYPSWSPDGRRITFYSNRNGDSELYVVELETVEEYSPYPLTDDDATVWNSDWSPDGEWIAFTSIRDGNREIYLLDPQGGDLQRLTDNNVMDGIPAWRPFSAAAESNAIPAPPPVAGEIVFYSERDGNAEIYTMVAGGCDPRRLTFHNADDYSPVWSPDGQQIAFLSERDDPQAGTCFPDCRFQLYLIDASGDNEQRLIETEFAVHHPDWHPDGGRLSFDTEFNLEGDIYLVNADGGGLELLIEDGFWADWSPDGSELVFASQRDGNVELYLAAADGTKQRRLTDNSTLDFFPDWLPDGRRIAFVKFEKRAIFVMNVDGSDERQLTYEGVSENPAWSPDGSWLAFQSSRSGNFEIYVVNVAGALEGDDGVEPIQLTDNNAADLWPAWRP